MSDKRTTLADGSDSTALVERPDHPRGGVAADPAVIADTCLAAGMIEMAATLIHDPATPAEIREFVGLQPGTLLDDGTEAPPSAGELADLQARAWGVRSAAVH